MACSPPCSIAGVAPLPALFLAFLERWQRGELPFRHGDASLDDTAARAICSAPDPVRALVADRGLWGELSGDERLVDAIRAASLRLRELASAPAA